MNQEKAKQTAQVFYNNRWVDKEFFRAFVYSATEQKLAESYKQYEELITTGLWFDSTAKALETKNKVPTGEVLDLTKAKARKPSNGANS